MMYPLVRELAARDAPIRVPVAVSCRVLNFSRQAYYQWAANPVPARDWEEAHLINAAIDHHREDPAFGYRFIADEINAGPGPGASERRIWRLCSENGILSVIHRRRRSGLKAGPPVHDDLIERDFSATVPNRKWLTDITEHHTAWIPAVVATSRAIRRSPVKQPFVQLGCPSRAISWVCC